MALTLLATTDTQIIRVVEALYNQRPGNTYLSNFQTFVTENGVDGFANALAANFASSTDAELAAVVTANLGLTGDALTAGNAYLEAQFAADAAGRGKAVLDAMNALSTLEADATYGAAAASFNADVVSSLSYSSIAANTAVTDSAAAVAAGQAYSLTTSVDLLTGSAGDDSFYGTTISDNGTGTTQNPGDNLNGGDGADSLNMTISGDPTATVVLQTSSVETYNVGNYDTATGTDVTLNLAATSGVTNFNVSGSGDTLVTGLSANAALGNSGTGDLSMTYASGVLAGTADTQAITLTDSGLSTDSPTLTVAQAGSAAAIAETLAVTSNGTANYLTLAASNNHTSLTVAGAGNLTVDAAADTTLTTIDASSATGNVAITNIGATALTMTGGSGDDTLRIAGSTITAADSVNAGEGTDSLQLTDAVASAAVGAKLAGFENAYVRVNDAVDAAATITQNVSYISGINTVGATSVTITDDNDGAANARTEAVAFTGMSAAQTAAISGITSAGDANDNGAMVAAFSFDLTTDTASDSGSITLGTASAAASTAGANNALTVSVTADDYETLSITNQGGTQTLSVLSATDATALNVTAAKAFTITGGGVTAGALRTVDASASTANFSIDGFTFAGASTLTGGAGNDNFDGSASGDSMIGNAGNDSLDGAAGNDTIDGGAGNDSITAGGGNDVLTGGDGDDIFVDAAADLDTASTETANVDGGAGNDTFTIADFSDLSSQTTINGGDGTDKISFTEAASHDFTGSATLFSNVSSIESYSFDGLNGLDTVTMNDANVSAGEVTVVHGTGSSGANTYDMDAILSSTSQINFTEADTGAATTYVVSNAKDSVTMVDGNDAFTVANNAYLSGADTIDGGTGTDTVTFTSTTGTTFTAAQLGAFSNTEAIQITSGGAGNYVMTLNDSIVGANVLAAGTFTVARTITADTGTLKVTASDVTSSYKLSLTGALGADSLIGGAGQDTIAGGVNDADIDVITGGAGNDTFTVDSGKSAVDIITDMDFGTSTTSVDKLSVAALDAADTLTWDDVGSNFAGGAIGKTSVLSATGTAVDTTVAIILNSASYATLAAAETALEALVYTNVDNDILFFWQDSFGNSHMSLGTDDGAVGDDGDDYAVTDLVQLTGVSISTIASNFDVGDIVAA